MLVHDVPPDIKMVEILIKVIQKTIKIIENTQLFRRLHHSENYFKYQIKNADITDPLFTSGLLISIFISVSQLRE